MIRIDSEFKALIPPLTPEEYAGLEDSIVREGCRDPLVLWGETLIDGHNRFEICAKHSGIPFTTVQREFDNRDDVIRWIIMNQFSRRNLPAYERARLALRLKPVIAEKAKERQNLGLKSDEGGRTDVTIAKVAGIGHDTIHKVETIEARADDATKQRLRSGDMSINQAYKAIKLEEKKEEIQRAEQAIVEQIENEAEKPVLYIGNSIGFEPDEDYDLLLTDPPYSTDVDNIVIFAASWLPNALKHIKSTGSAYVFIGAYPKELRAYLTIRPPEHIELAQLLVWTYKNTLGQNPNDRYKQNWQACLYYRGKDAPPLDCPLTTEQWAVQEINAPDGRQGDRYHKWQKPMAICERFIRHSTKPGMTVFDPFACTGTTLLAAAKLGRIGYGFEIDKDNAELAKRRGCDIREWVR